MSVWLNSKSKIVVQGITGKNGQFHSKQMLDYGTKLIGGVTPGKGGQETLGVPIWNTMDEAVDAGANVSCVFVPPPFAADAIMESADSGVDLIVAITEGIPALDMVKVKKYIKDTEIDFFFVNYIFNYSRETTFIPFNSRKIQLLCLLVLLSLNPCKCSGILLLGYTSFVP